MTLTATISICICCIIMMLMILFQRRSLQKPFGSEVKLRMLVQTMVVMLIAYTLLQILLNAQNEDFVSPGLLFFSQVLYLGSFPFLAFFWFMFVYHKVYSSYYKIKALGYMVYLPIIIIISVALLEQLEYTLEGTLILNPRNTMLWYSTAIVSQVYLLSAAVIAFVNVRKAQTLSRVIELHYYGIIIFIPIASVAIQVFMPVDFPLVPMVFTLSVLHVYLSYLDRNITIDSTTKLSNRVALDNFLMEHIQNINFGKRLFLLCITANGPLKKETKEEHVVYLCNVADYLKQECAGQDVFLSYSNKNHFMIVIERDSFAAVETFCQQLVSGVKNYRKPTVFPIEFSINYAEYGVKNIKTVRQLINDLPNQWYKAT